MKIMGFRVVWGVFVSSSLGLFVVVICIFETKCCRFATCFETESIVGSPLGLLLIDC